MSGFFSSFVFFYCQLRQEHTRELDELVEQAGASGGLGAVGAREMVGELNERINILMAENTVMADQVLLLYACTQTHTTTHITHTHITHTHTHHTHRHTHKYAQTSHTSTHKHAHTHRHKHTHTHITHMLYRGCVDSHTIH